MKKKYSYEILNDDCWLEIIKKLSSKPDFHNNLLALSKVSAHLYKLCQYGYKLYQNKQLLLAEEHPTSNYTMKKKYSYEILNDDCWLEIIKKLSSKPDFHSNLLALSKVSAHLYELCRYGYKLYQNKQSFSSLNFNLSSNEKFDDFYSSFGAYTTVISDYTWNCSNENRMKIIKNINANNIHKLILHSANAKVYNENETLKKNVREVKTFNLPIFDIVKAFPNMKYLCIDSYYNDNKFINFAGNNEIIFLPNEKCIENLQELHVRFSHISDEEKLRCIWKNIVYLINFSPNLKSFNGYDMLFTDYMYILFNFENIWFSTSNFGISYYDFALLIACKSLTIHHKYKAKIVTLPPFIQKLKIQNVYLDCIQTDAMKYLEDVSISLNVHVKFICEWLTFMPNLRKAYIRGKICVDSCYAVFANLFKNCTKLENLHLQLCGCATNFKLVEEIQELFNNWDFSKDERKTLKFSCGKLQAYKNNPYKR